MTNELTQTFAFGETKVTVIIENGEPLFCAKEVCDILGYKNPRDAIAKHTISEGVVKRDLVKTLSNGRQQTFEMTFIDERNLYRLVMYSDLPSAVKFQDWVCGEVLPTIRKTGSYGKAPAIPEGLPNFTDPAEAAIAWAQKVKLLQAAEKKTKELEAANQQLTDQAAVNAPKVTFANSVTSGNTEVTITVAAKTLGIGPRKFFDWLRLNGFLYKQANQATQYAIEKGYMVTRFAKITHDDDSVEKKPYPHVTGKGLFYFYGRLLKEGLIAKNDNLELAA